MSTGIEKNLSRADKDCYISILNIIQGEVDPTQVCLSVTDTRKSIKGTQTVLDIRLLTNPNVRCTKAFKEFERESLLTSSPGDLHRSRLTSKEISLQLDTFLSFFDTFFWRSCFCPGCPLAHLPLRLLLPQSIWPHVGQPHFH